MRGRTGFVSIVGAGPWDPGLITVAGVRRLQRADVVVADYLANPNLLLHAPPDAELIQRESGPHGLQLRQHELNELLVDRAGAGKFVVRLKGGDPCMFGRGAEEAAVLREAGIPYEFIPGVSSPVAAPEVAGIPVTHRDHTPAVTFVSGYEAYDKAGLHVAWEHLARSAGTLVLMMSVKNARVNAERLVAAGRAASTPAAAVRWGTRGISTTVTGTLATIAEQIEHAGLRAPAVLVVGDVVDLRAQLRWDHLRPLCGLRIGVTRPRERIGPVLDQLHDWGADAVAVPTLEQHPPADPAAFAAALSRLASPSDAIDGLILSSPSGVDAFFDGLARAQLDVRALAGRCVVAIGPSTAAACRARGLHPDIVPKSARSEGVVEALADRARGRWLHVRGEHGRKTLATAIASAGGTYDLAIGYRMLRPALPDAIARSLLEPTVGGEGLDAWCVYSGRAGEHLVEMLRSALPAADARRLVSATPVVSAGPVTTARLRELGFADVRTADRPSDDAVLAALAERFGRAQPSL